MAKETTVEKKQNVVRTWDKGMQLTKPQKRVLTTILDKHAKGVFKRACLDANQALEVSKRAKVRKEKED